MKDYQIVAWAFVAVGVLLLFVLAWLPGYCARERGHANAAAITVCGWLSLVMPVLWVVAMIWAHTGPDHSDWVKWQKQERKRRRRGFDVKASTDTAR